MRPFPMFSVEEPAKSEPKFSPFTGVARRLNGKISEIPVSSTLKELQPGSNANGTASSSTSASSSQPSGKLVFGSTVTKNEWMKETGKVRLLQL